MSAVFQGFPPAAFRFLHDLKANNEKAWFEAHKRDYLDHVQKPALALVETLGAALHADFPAVGYDARAKGGSLMRIYRDTRFSADKSPYKTEVAMMFHAGGKKMESPGFGLRVATDSVDLMAGIFTFNKTQLAAYRATLDDAELGAALDAAAQAVRAAGPYTFGSAQYKRVPAGYPANHPRADWLKYGGLHVFSPSLPVESVQSAAFVEMARAHFRAMAPVVAWLLRVL